MGDPRTALTAGVVADRLAVVRSRIEAAGGDPGRVRVVAVTKGFGPAAVEAAAGAGLLDVGENYAQELTGKVAATEAIALRWHFLGPVQRNKVARLAAVVAVWQSVDRLAAVEAIAAASAGAPVFIQVNLAAEPNRPGCSWAAVGDLVRRAQAAGLDVQGLMGVAPLGPGPGAAHGHAGPGGRAGPAAGEPAARFVFARLACTAAELGLAELSMGMSDDLEAAVAEGSTLVRIGRGLFGPRPERAGMRR